MATQLARHTKAVLSAGGDEPAKLPIGVEYSRVGDDRPIAFSALRHEVDESEYTLLLRDGVTDALFVAEPGAFLGPLRGASGFYIALVVKHNEGRNAVDLAGERGQALVRELRIHRLFQQWTDQVFAKTIIRVPRRQPPPDIAIFEGTFLVRESEKQPVCSTEVVRTASTGRRIPKSRTVPQAGGLLLTLGVDDTSICLNERESSGVPGDTNQVPEWFRMMPPTAPAVMFAARKTAIWPTTGSASQNICRSPSHRIVGMSRSLSGTWGRGPGWPAKKKLFSLRLWRRIRAFLDVPKTARSAESFVTVLRPELSHAVIAFASRGCVA